MSATARAGRTEGRDADDPDARCAWSLRRLLEEGQDGLDEGEVAEMVPELDLDAVDELVRPGHDAGVADDDVEARLALLEGLARLLGRRELGEVEGEEDELVVAARVLLGEALDRAARLLLAAASEVDLGALAPEGADRDEADAVVPPSDAGDLRARAALGQLNEQGGRGARRRGRAGWRTLPVRSGRSASTSNAREFENPALEASPPSIS